MAERIPKPGDTVHFVLAFSPNEGQHRTAQVMGVNGDDLHVEVTLTHPDDVPGIENGIAVLHSILYDAGGKPGTWHWPE